MESNFEVPSVFRIFLNYPFDEEFEPLEHAMHFAVVAAGLIPVCAKDKTAPDLPRLTMLVEIISSCYFSIHDFSRYKGEGEQNFARFNMPIEMGMALFYSHFTKQASHRCAFFVPTQDDYKKFASDLAGLDPKYHGNDELQLVRQVHEWLGQDGKGYASMKPISKVLEKYRVFQEELGKVKGSGKKGRPTHNESQELMYRLCSKWGWWKWRKGEFKVLFPKWPLIKDP
jgi:hypothetical protein